MINQAVPDFQIFSYPTVKLVNIHEIIKPYMSEKEKKKRALNKFRGLKEVSKKVI